MSVLDIYVRARALTGRMLVAAREQNWDELVSAGVEREQILAVLPQAIPPTTLQEREQVAHLIREILACHTEISERANPWLEHTATLLAAFGRQGSTAVSATQTNPS